MSQSASRSRSLSARGYFVLFIVLLLLPILAFAGLLAYQYAQSERSRLAAAVQATTQQIAVDIDRDLIEMLASLHTLSTSRLLAERDFAAFHRQMTDARAYIGADIVLRTPDGQKIIDTQVPWGETLGRFSLPRDRDVLAEKTALVSGVFTDRDSRETRFAAIVPVLNEGKVEYLLSFVVPTRRLVPFLRREQTDFVAASVSDRNGNLVARSNRHEEVSGTPGNAAFLAAAGRNAEGIWTGDNIDGMNVVIAYRRSPISDWVVGSSITYDSLQAPLNASLKAFLGLGLIALTLSLALALGFGRKIAVPLADLARGATALGQGQDMALQRSGVREIDDIAEELERSAHDLRERESELSRVQQIGRAGGFEIDLTDGFRKRLSPEFLRLYGIKSPQAGYETHDEWLGRIHPADRDHAEQSFQDSLRSSATDYAMEYRLVRPDDGEVRWVSVKGEIERDTTGRARRVLGASTDVTELKQAETALQLLNESLEAQVEERGQQVAQLQKLEAIGKLTGGVAHDFNNLLTAVVGNLELLKKRIPDEPRLHRLIDNALQGTGRGAALTQRLLAFARRQELRPEAVDVGKLVEGMTELLQRSLGAMVEIETAVPAHLRLAKVDANQLELAILNLAVNGRDAMPKGGKLSITARNEATFAHGLGDIEDGDYVVIAVKDTGEGMDETTLRRATEPFFTTKGIGKGTGLGLSMAHGLAAQSGGALRLKSTVGKGTVAELWLPRAAAEDSQVAAPIAEADLSARPRRRVLLVDDDALVLAGTSAVLDDLQHDVVEAASARQALDLLRKGAAVDIVVTDHAMPGMTGTELASDIAREWPQLPVILATGYADLPEGAAPDLPRLAKPFGQDALAQAIEAAIAARSASRV